MAVAASAPLMAELEGAVNNGSSERRVQMLQRITDLFLADADRLNENQIGIFDDILIRLIERVEAQTLAQLSATLCESRVAPKQAVRQLACHEEGTVAVPVLSKSSRISQSDLVAIAGTRGQQHLLAISSRETLDARVTDVLLKRGDASVSHALATNTGARFSDAGYASLVESAGRDGELAEKLGIRRDIPDRMLRELLSKATVAVRARMLKTASPEMREQIQKTIQAITEQIAAKPAPPPVDYSRYETAVLALNRAGKLGDQTINRFAVQGEYPNIIAALSLLAAVKIEAIESLMTNPRPDGLIVACKASRLDWSTTRMILRNRPGCAPPSKQDLEQAREMFEALSLSAAQRTIQFWPERDLARKPDVLKSGVPKSEASKSEASKSGVPKSGVPKTAIAMPGI